MTSQNTSVTSNLHYVSESPRIEITEKNAEIQERICKWLSYIEHFTAKTDTTLFLYPSYHTQ